MRASLVVLAAAAVLLTGCGDETASPTATPDEGTTSVQPSEPTDSPVLVPACDDVWTQGAKLPADYAGCQTQQAMASDGEGIYCESGQVIFTHEQFYAAAGRKVTQADGPLKKDADFQQALKACRG